MTVSFSLVKIRTNINPNTHKRGFNMSTPRLGDERYLLEKNPDQYVQRDSESDLDMSQEIESSDDRVTHLRLSDSIFAIFDDIAEHILLFPFDSDLKENLREGKIERPIHGVQHAVRVAIFIKIFCEFYRLMYKENKNLISDREIKILQIVGFLHDAMRENDFKDEWEEKSAGFCKKYLMDLGVSREEAYQFASLILTKEKGDLFGKIFQSSDALDIPRVRRQFYIERMSIYQDAKTMGVQQAVVQIVQSALALLHFQYELRVDVEVYAEGKYLFTQKKNSEPNRALLKAEYEHAENCYEKTLHELEYFPLLDDFYDGCIVKIDPIHFSTYDHVSQFVVSEKEEEALSNPLAYKSFLRLLQESIQNEPEISIFDFYKRVFLIYKKLPETKFDSISNCLKLNFPFYWENRFYFLRLIQSEYELVEDSKLFNIIFTNQNDAESYLFFLKLNHHSLFLNLDLKERIISGLDCFYCSLTQEQADQISHDREKLDILIKNVRWDARCFIRDCLKGLTLSKESEKDSIDSVRKKPHKAFTVFGNGYFSRENKNTRMNQDEFLEFKERKKLKSQHQSFSLSFDQCQSRVFGDSNVVLKKSVILMLDPKNNIANRFFIYSGATFNRFYEFDTQEKAFEFFYKMVYQDKKMFPDYESFKKGILLHKNQINEALYYASWNILTSAIGVASDTFESRCIAQHYAKLLMHYLQKQYADLGKILPQDYEAPIQFYLPGTALHLSAYTKQQKEKDIELANQIFNSDHLFFEKLQENSPEFMLLLNEDQCDELLNRKIMKFTVIIYLILNGYFELVDSIYEKTKISKTKTLESYLKDTITIDEIRLIKRSRINEMAKAPIWSAAMKNRWDLFPVFEHQLGMQDGNKDTILTLALSKKENEVALKIVQYAEFGINLKNSTGKSALILAIEHRSAEVLNYLLNHEKIDLTTSDNSQQTALVYAVSVGDLGLVRYLTLKNKLLVAVQNREGETALMLAIQSNQLGIANIILNVYQDNPNFNIHKTDHQGNHALALAVQRNWIPFVRIMLKFPEIQLNQIGESGRTPMFYSLFQKDSKLFNAFVLNMNVNVNAQDFFGNTILMFLAARGCRGKIKTLLKRTDIDLNIQNQKDETALSLALSKGHVDIAEIFLNYPGIDVGLENKKGVSALSLACMLENENLICLIAMKRLEAYEKYLTSNKKNKVSHENLWASSARSDHHQKAALVNRLKQTLSDYPNQSLTVEDEKLISENKFLNALFSLFPDQMKITLFQESLRLGYESN